MSRAWLVAVLLLGAAGLVPVGTAQTHATVHIAVTGALTGASYLPLVSDSEFTDLQDYDASQLCSSGCGGATPVPANEWLWVNIQALDPSGQPMIGDRFDVAVCYDPHCLRFMGSLGDTGPNGTASMIIPPAKPGESFVQIQASLYSRTAYYGAWDAILPVHGAVPSDPHEIVIEPKDAWVMINATPAREDYFYWAIDANAPRSEANVVVDSNQAPLSAYFIQFDIWEPTVGGGGWALDFSSEPAQAGFDVHGPVSASEHVPIPVNWNRQGENFATATSGTFAPGQFIVNASLARFGFTPQEGVKFIYYSAQQGSWNLSEVGSGPVRGVAGSPSGNPTVTATAASLGPRVGGFSSTMQVAPGQSMLMALAGANTFGVGTGTIARTLPNGTTERVSSSPGMFELRQGDCAGNWTASLTTSVDMYTAQADLFLAPGLTINPDLAWYLGVPNGCDP